MVVCVCVCVALCEMRSSIESERLIIFTMHIRQKRITTVEKKNLLNPSVTIGKVRLKIHAQSVCGNRNDFFKLFLVTLSCSCRRGFRFCFFSSFQFRYSSKLAEKYVSGVFCIFPHSMHKISNQRCVCKA